MYRWNQSSPQFGVQRISTSHFPRMVFEFHQPVRQEVQESILLLLLLCFIVIRMVWWCDGLVTEQLSPWHSDSCVSMCHLYPCTTVPIITFTVSVWSFMFSVGYKSSTAHIILPYDCRLCIMTEFSVIKSTWTRSFKSPSLSFQCSVFQGLQVWSCLFVLSNVTTVLLVKETWEPNYPESISNPSEPNGTNSVDDHSSEVAKIGVNRWMGQKVWAVGTRLRIARKRWNS